MKRTLGITFAALSAWILFIVLVGHVKSETNSPHVTAVATSSATEPANPARAKKCTQLINDVNRHGLVWKDWRRVGDDVIVQVRGGFYLADLDDKKVFDAAVRCAVSEGRIDDQGLMVVEYKDAQTGKTVAEWGKYTGFEMKN